MNPVSKTISILGGTGFIGSHLCAKLASEGHTLKVLTRRRARSKHLLVLPSAQLIEGSVFDETALDEMLKGSDVLINLVGILNETGSDGSGFAKAHVEVTRQALRACARNGIGRYLHMSALHANDNAPSYYLRSKAQAESLLRKSEIDWTIFRPSVVFGPGDSFFNRFASLLKLSPGIFPLAAADSRFAPVFVDDIVSAFIRSLDARDTCKQTYDLCGPEIYTLKEILAYTAQRIDKRCLILELPDALAQLQARFLELIPGKPLSRDNLRSLEIDSVCNGEHQGFAALGIKPGTIDAVVPNYLHSGKDGGRYGDYRKFAGR